MDPELEQALLKIMLRFEGKLNTPGVRQAIAHDVETLLKVKFPFYHIVIAEDKTQPGQLIITLVPNQVELTLSVMDQPTPTVPTLGPPGPVGPPGLSDPVGPTGPVATHMVADLHRAMAYRPFSPLQPIPDLELVLPALGVTGPVGSGPCPIGTPGPVGPSKPEGVNGPVGIGP